MKSIIKGLLVIPIFAIVGLISVNTAETSNYDFDRGESQINIMHTPGSDIILGINFCHGENNCCGARCSASAIESCCEATDCKCMPGNVQQQVAGELGLPYPTPLNIWENVSPQTIAEDPEVKAIITHELGIPECE